MFSDNSQFDSSLSIANLMIEKFNYNKHFVSLWLNKFESVADYVGIPDHRMGEFFYSMLESPENLKITKDESSSHAFNYSYEEIKHVFFSCYGQLDAIKIARDRFKHRMQYGHETIVKYAVNLHALFIECSYAEYGGSKLTRRFLDGLLIKDICISILNVSSYNLPFKEAILKAVELHTQWQIKRINEQMAKKQETNKTG